MTGGDLLVTSAAFAGGVLNAVAGGGSFLTFPALCAIGIVPVEANATSTVALWPASLSSAWGFRENLQDIRRYLLPLGVVSLLGGWLGAELLLWTRNETFVRIVPFLLGAATLLFATSGKLVARLRKGQNTMNLPTLALIHLPVAIYGGYFGGGMGILMLAAFAVAGMRDIHAMNGLKSLLGATINGIAVLVFVLGGSVHGRQALLMAAGSVVGGYVGARGSKYVQPQRIRVFVVVVGAVMTAKFALDAMR